VNHWKQLGTTGNHWELRKVMIISEPPGTTGNYWETLGTTGNYLELLGTTYSEVMIYQ